MVDVAGFVEALWVPHGVTLLAVAEIPDLIEKSSHGV
jgi:hypothetical protein